MGFLLTDVGGDVKLSESIEQARRKSRSFPLHTSLKWFVQISLGLEYLHRQHLLAALNTDVVVLSRNSNAKISSLHENMIMSCPGLFENMRCVQGGDYRRLT